ncbi:MAG: LysR family transcriptional regulator [Rhodospirillales bacterium]|nr:LysR family transcriptional regulator [Rhodospirillales bacterium]
MKVDFEISLLRTFVAVVETYSFTGAARRLNCVQSAVSTQILKLEKIAGGGLIDRGRGRSVSVTEKGERLCHYARSMLALNSEALSEVGGSMVQELIRPLEPLDIPSLKFGIVI